MKDNHSEIYSEANVLSTLSHVNIVQFFGLYKENETVYIVIEFMELGSLKFAY